IGTGGTAGLAISADAGASATKARIDDGTRSLTLMADRIIARRSSSLSELVRALESTLYPPVKRFIEKLGFEVKGEVCGCDLVALDGNEPTAVVIGELKLTFTLDLVLQAVDRTAACDEVWLAVRASRRGRGREHDPRVRKLCRLLGLGPLCGSARRRCAVLVQTVPWRPRGERQEGAWHRV